MKPPVETVRVSKQGREQLAKLRKHTGIQHWNALCRWAMCASFAEPATPPAVTEKLDGGIEMAWKIFAGEYNEIYAALVWTRVLADGLPHTSEGASQCLRAHIHRGLAYLSSGYDTRSVGSFTARWIAGSEYANL